ncbi:MAG: sel1 repeat family protein, partial [Synergistaceae bacterium]|nr:sel1 repeat family protein [Synergistaceae bacterium]
MNDAEKYRKEGLELEQQEKYEEAFLKYEEAAKMEDTPSMIYIARMYLSGKFRAVESSNLAELLIQGGPIFPWSLRNEKRPDYKSALKWLMKAAELGSGLACETVGNMLCNGVGCNVDIERGISYFEKAVANGHNSARKYTYLYRPDGKVLTDEEYEICLTEFFKTVESSRATDVEDD